jgi:hypothetical protein
MTREKQQKRVTRGKQGGRGRPKQVTTNSSEAIDQPKTPAGQIAAPSEAFRSVDAITRCEEQSGWPTREAFACAMLMHIHGVTVREGEWLFRDAARRVQ